MRRSPAGQLCALLYDIEQAGMDIGASLAFDTDAPKDVVDERRSVRRALRTACDYIVMGDLESAESLMLDVRQRASRLLQMGDP